MTKRIYLLSILVAACCGLGCSVQAAELVLNGSFTTTPVLGDGVYSSDVGRDGSGASYVLDGTTGTTGWTTTESDARFEVWSAGYLGSPTGVGNTLELSNNNGGETISQSVTSSAAGAASATFSFGYATRDNGNDKFTVTITDTTQTGSLLNLQFDPTGDFTTNDAYSQVFTITPGDVYEIAFQDQNTAGNLGASYSTSAHIDNVSFIQPAPEPSAWIFAAAGGVLFAAWKHRNLRSTKSASLFSRKN